MKCAEASSATCLLHLGLRVVSDGHRPTLQFFQRVAVLAVLDEPAVVREFVAHAVGFLPVFGEASLPAGFGECANGFGSIRAVFLFLRQCESERAQHAVESGECGGGLLAC
jgi:hypothetical protein